MFVDYGLERSATAPLFLSFLVFQLLVLFCYVWFRRLVKTSQICYPLLGHQQSPHLREIVQGQWRKVALKCCLASSNLHRGSQDKERKYMLQLPFRQMFVLPSHYVNDYAWKPEPEICWWYISVLKLASADSVLLASNIDLRERLLGRSANMHLRLCLFLKADR